MSSVVISGDTSGTITLAAPAVSGSNTITLPAATGTLMVSGNMPAFSAYLNNNQSITAGQTIKVLYDAKEFDTASCFDITTNKGRFTPNVAGYYQVNGSNFINAAVDQLLIVYKNGSAYKFGSEATTSYQSVVSSLVYCNGTTDYIELYLYCSSSQTISASSTRTWFNGSMVRAA